MNGIDELSIFEAVNNSIKEALDELDDLVHSQHSYFDSQELAKNNAAFLELLDQLLELISTVESIKK